SQNMCRLGDGFPKQKASPHARSLPSGTLKRPGGTLRMWPSIRRWQSGSWQSCWKAVISAILLERPMTPSLPRSAKACPRWRGAPGLSARAEHRSKSISVPLITKEPEPLSSAETPIEQPFMSRKSGATEIFLIRHADALPAGDEIVPGGTYDDQPLSS